MRLRGWTALLAVVAAVPSVMCGVAAADPGPVVAEEEVHTVSAESLEAAETPGSEAEGQAKKEVSDHLNREMRSGRPVDTMAVNSVSVEIPEFGRVGAVLSVREDLEELVGVERANPDGSEQRFVGAVLTEAASTTQASGGPGSDAATGYGATRTNYACRSLFWDASYSGTADHYVYDCWEKFRANSDTSNWAYNRYTLFDPANADQTGERGEIIDATIRTRPWSGTTNVTGGPYSYKPVPSSTCTTTTVGVQIGPGQISVPLVSCGAHISVFPLGSNKSMGTDWNGRTTGQVYIDYAFALTTNGTAPTYADYVWLEVQNCFASSSCVAWNPSEYETWKDSGY